MDGNDGLVLGDAGVIRFFPGQFIEMAIEDLLKKGGKTKVATADCSLMVVIMNLTLSPL